MLRVLPAMFKPVNNLICCKTGLMWVGKRTIATQLVLQQYCKTSSTFFVTRFSVPFKGFHLKSARLPGLSGRLLRVKVIKTILGSRTERTRLLNYYCCVISARACSLLKANAPIFFCRHVIRRII